MGTSLKTPAWGVSVPGSLPPWAEHWEGTPNLPDTLPQTLVSSVCGHPACNTRLNVCIICFKFVYSPQVGKHLPCSLHIYLGTSQLVNILCIIHKIILHFLGIIS